MDEKTKWYNTNRFYKLALLNDETIYWWSSLSLNEIKDQIATQGFVLVSSGRKDYYKEEDINTKVIRSVKDITKEERKRCQERDQDLVRRMRLIRSIRNAQQPRSVRRIIQKLEKCYRKEKEQNRWHWYEKDSSMHLDILMYYNEDYLKKMLEKCKKTDLVS